MSPFRNFSNRSALGVILAVALGALSLANWAERGRFGVPEDGVVWDDSEAGVLAVRVETDSPAARVGVRPGDTLRSIGGKPVSEALDVTRILVDIGSWNRTEYVIERDGSSRRLALVVGESSSQGTVGGFLLLLGWSYALIGVLVWMRCPRDSSAVRFCGFCLASFALYSLSATGALDGFDRLVYWLDVWALLLVPPLFLDFCDRFPNGIARYQGWTRLSYGIAIAVGAAHHAASGGWVSGGIGDPELLRFFDSAPLVLLTVNLILAALVVWTSNRNSENPVYRVQMRALLFGAIVSVVPFTLLYAIPFMLEFGPGPNQSFSVFSLAALPASIGLALFRYRLLEFEVIWKRATASAMTAGLLLAVGYLLLILGSIPPLWLERHGPVVWLCSLAVATALFRPVRDGILRFFEQRAYRERYEERRTLAEFAAELATDTNFKRIAEAVCARLANALQIRRVLVLARSVEATRGKPIFQVVRSKAAAQDELAGEFDLSAIANREPEFSTTAVITESLDSSLPAPLASLGCRHFVPCRLRGRTLAWIALGSRQDGSLLSSEDLSLVEALAAPFAIALENARLYSSLQAKARQYQRLKDYNENIVESLSVGILALDLEDRVKSWNTQLELAFHISRDSAIGRRIEELLPASLVQQVAQCLDDNGAGQLYKLRLRAADFPEEFRPDASENSSERVFNIAIAPLIAKNFHTVGRLMILDDVTERVDLEERLVHADKLSAAGLLAAGVAHEVNTPLAVISTYSQMLAEQFSQESAEARMLSKVTEQTFRASEIVNSLLDFSRTSSAQMGPCDLKRAIEDTLKLIAPQLRQADIGVRTQLSTAGPVLGNRGKLQQVFLNLFLNARDAMPGGGTLAVSAREVTPDHGASYAEVLVSDTGLGIDPAEQRRIFDPFYTTKDAGRGTGLGLAVTFGIVKEHSGSITVESAPEQGTTFSLAFPLAKQPVNG